MPRKTDAELLRDAQDIVREKNQKIALLERDLRRAKLPPRPISKTLLRQREQAHKRFAKTYAKLIEVAGKDLAQRIYLDVLHLATVSMMIGDRVPD